MINFYPCVISNDSFTVACQHSTFDSKQVNKTEAQTRCVKGERKEN